MIDCVFCDIQSINLGQQDIGIKVIYYPAVISFYRAILLNSALFLSLHFLF